MRLLLAIFLIMLVLPCTAMGQEFDRTISTSPLWIQIEDPNTLVPYDLNGTILQANPQGLGYHKYRIEFSERTNTAVLEDKEIDFTFTVKAISHSAPTCTVKVKIPKGEVSGLAEVFVPVPEQLYDVQFDTVVNGTRVPSLCYAGGSKNIPYYVRVSTILIGDELDSATISDAGGLMLEETSIDGAWSSRIRVLDSYTINKPPQSYLNSNFAESHDLRFAPIDRIPTSALEWSTSSDVYLPSRLLGKLTSAQSECLKQFVRNSGILVIYGDGSADKLIEQSRQWFDPQHHYGDQDWQTSRFTLGKDPGLSYGLGYLQVLPEMPIHWLLRKDNLKLYLSGKHITNLSSNGVETLRQQSFWNWYLTRLGQPPVAAFATLIVVFAGVIAPALLIYCLRANRAVWLLVIFPIIAIIGTASLVGFAVLHDGLDMHTRVRSLTLLDKNSDQGLCVTRQVMFSGMTPNEPIDFEKSTQAWPIDQSISRNRELEGGRIFWKDDKQVFENLVRPREQFQFATYQDIRNLKPFEWVAYPKPSANDANILECKIKNLLEEPLALVVITDANENCFVAKNVGNLAAVKLNQVTATDATMTLEAIEGTQPLALPAGLRGGRPRGILESFLGIGPRGQRMSSRNQYDVMLGVNQRLIQIDFLKDNRCFFVYPQQGRHVDRAFEGADEQDSLHMIFGLWEAKP